MEPAEPMGGSPPAGKAKAVLLVDDSQAMLAALTDLIEGIGSLKVVSVAMRETQATEWLRKNRDWDLAVLDLMLQEGTGFNLIRRCKGANPCGKVVVFSEFATAALKVRCVELGADAVFRKSELPAFVRYLERFGAAGHAMALAS